MFQWEKGHITRSGNTGKASAFVKTFVGFSVPNLRQSATKRTAKDRTTTNTWIDAGKTPAKAILWDRSSPGLAVGDSSIKSVSNFSDRSRFDHTGSHGSLRGGTVWSPTLPPLTCSMAHGHRPGPWPSEVVQIVAPTKFTPKLCQKVGKT